MQVHPSEKSQIEEALLRKINSKCAQRDGHSCMMLKIVTYMNRMLKKASIQIDDGIEIARYRYGFHTHTFVNAHIYSMHAMNRNNGCMTIISKIYNAEAF